MSNRRTPWHCGSVPTAGELGTCGVLPTHIEISWEETQLGPPGIHHPPSLTAERPTLHMQLAGPDGAGDVKHAGLGRRFVMKHG